MSVQLNLLSLNESYNQADVVYTPDHVAHDIIAYFKPSGKCLDPCKGNGAFLKFMPGADWCEIREGRDFFDYTQQVDWIVSNPPYSIFTEWIIHSFEIAEHIVYLMPIMKLIGAQERLEKIYKLGGIVAIRFYGKGNDNGFPFGWPVGAVYFQKGYAGGISVSFASPANNRINPTTNSGRENWLFN